MHCIEEGSDHDLRTFYPSFEPVIPPPRSKAVSAWKGQITPFPDSSDLALIVHDLERHAVVDIDVGGALRHSSMCSGSHSDAPFLGSLTNMDVTFEVLVLEFSAGRHRQTYCLRPQISSRIFPTHPHLRRDQMLLTETGMVDAICPYRSDETRPSNLLQYLDFISIFLAKHLIWVRTLALTCYSDFAAPRVVYTPQPNAAHFSLPVPTTPLVWAAPWSRISADPLHVCALAAGESHIDRWEGIWVGPSAPHEPLTILQSVGANDECTCGSGRRYGTCCRRIHMELCKPAPPFHVR
jgi:SEC-C motif